MKSKVEIRDRLRREPDERLVSSLLRSDPEIQRKIAYELGRRGASGAAAALRILLRSSEPEVRAAAAEALGRLNDHASGNPLTELLADQTQPTFVRDTCAYALARIAYSPALETLIAALNDPAETVRSSASAAIAAIVSNPDFRPRPRDARSRGIAGLPLAHDFESRGSATSAAEFLRKHKTSMKQPRLEAIFKQLRKSGWRTVKTYHSKSHMTVERFLSSSPKRKFDPAAESLRKLLETA